MQSTTQSNGVAERFIRTLKEECTYVNDCETLEEAREAIRASSSATTAAGFSSATNI
ncbi:integrase core domain-containing protein [Candidatus Palauibacter sp.]|uniref:integrase core domain-containing protein n=1 Tax=Candidatus Palauibacter sp. TaxID=3101350 RepID=UPI003CC5DFF5